MSSRRHSNHRGQAMVEFAMILLVLLLIIFVLIEAARLFQANLTVQKAAREAGRYAITGQFDTDCLVDSPPCADPRVVSVQRVAEAGLVGLRLNADADARMREPNAYLIQVLTPATDGSGWVEGVGDSGAPVMVRVLYEMDIITPLLRPIAEVIRVTGQVVMNNELANQIAGTSGDPSAPNLPPPPTVPPPPPPPDVELTMSGPPRALTGSTYDYTLVVRNNSNELAATNVTVVDTLPDVTLVSAPGCSESGGTVTCLIGTLDPMAQRSFILSVQASDEEVTVTNNAEVTLDQADPYLDNNVAAVTTIFEEDPVQTDVEISKTGPAIVEGGEDFTYRLIIANISLVPANGVEVVDTLPDDVAMGVAPDGCIFSGNTVSCSIGDMAPLSDVEIILPVTAPMTVGTITNNVSVTAASPVETNYDNNDAAAETEVVVLPDLQVALYDTPDPVMVGGDLTYEIIVTNNGNGDATNVVLTNIMPDSVDYDSVTPSDNCARWGNIISCTIGNLPSGASTARFILVRPAESGGIVNTASAYGDEDDRNAADNVAVSVRTTVEATTDLEITKTGPGTAEQGEEFNYTLTVRNLGPSAATGVTVRDTLPAGLSAVSATTSQGYCDLNASPIVCSLGRMDSGGSATITLRVTAFGVGSFTNVATISGGENDPDTSNNTGRATTTVFAGNYFMTATPLCGEAGERVMVRGYNWRNDNRTVTIKWNNGATLATTSSGTGDWGPVAIDIPGGAADGIHTISAQITQGNQNDSVTFTIPCPAPNLIVGQPTIVGSLPSAPGQPTTVRVGIQNIGNLDAVSQFFVGLYINPVPEPVPASTHLPAAQRVAIVAVNGLQEGQSKTVNFSLPAGLNSGTNRIYAVVDSDPGPTGNIQERYETDNISTPLQLVIGGGTRPTPTPTPAPSNPGSVAGRVRNEAGNPQAIVEIRLYDESDNSLESMVFSDYNGSYFFASVEADRYTMMACIRIEDASSPGQFNDYWASVPGVLVSTGQTTTQNLFLQLAPEGCHWP